MDKKIFAYLKSYSTNSVKIDRLLVSAYLHSEGIYEVCNVFLKSFIINSNDEDYKFLLDFTKLYRLSSFEDLIESFEFVVSPSDKIINGAVYTPQYIREYIIEYVLSETTKDTSSLMACDISCGCGGFLLTLAQEIKKRTEKSFYSIYRDNIYGVDIADYSITRTKILLSLLAVTNGEDISEFIFNLETGNSMNFNWKEIYSSIKNNLGFDIIVGNPPYVTSRNMDNDTINLLQNWEVTSSGHPDLYIPFFQIGYENLNSSGILGYITVNTFLKSVNGRSLREYFSKNRVGIKIINFGGEQVFRNRNTYTCLCFLKYDSNEINYIRTTSRKIFNLSKNDFIKFNYSNLNDFDGWNLVNTKEMSDFVSFIENVGNKFKNLFITKNGIATLSNDSYKFFPLREDLIYYYFINEGVEHFVEKAICRSIINPNKIKIENNQIDTNEKIIFPYKHVEGSLQIITETDFLNIYPRAHAYLSKHKTILANRDKGKGNYETWYAYGRKQSMDIKGYKLFFPHICERPSFVISEDEELLFYNGIAVVSKNLLELKALKLILESDIFYHYIRNTTKDYSSGYISMSKNYIKNFGIVQMNDEQVKALLESDNPNDYVNKLYNINTDKFTY